jgi:DNA-binding response OmpR family regulator
MNYKLLLADDSIAIQKVVELMLSDENVTLMIADNGEKAFEIIQKERPDVIFIDADITKLDGYEFCKRLRKNKELKSIPVVLLVAAFGSFDERKAREVGVSSHLSKPFLAEELLGKIDEVMSEQQAEAQRDKEEAEKEVIEIPLERPSPFEKEQVSVSQREEEERETRYRDFDISDEETEVEYSGKARERDRESDIPLESISLEEEIKRAQESIDFSALDADELVSSLKDELSDRLPDKDEILNTVREITRASLKESIDDIKGDIKEAVKESLVSRSEVNQLVEDTVKENLRLIVEDIKTSMSEKVNDLVSALVVEKSDVIDAISQSAREPLQQVSSLSFSELAPILKAAFQERLEQIVQDIKTELTQNIKESCKNVVVEKDDIISALNQSAHESFQHISSISLSEVSPLLESVLKERLAQIVDTLKSGLAQKVNESCEAVVIEKDDIADALKQGAQESLKHVLSPSGYDMAESLKSSLSSISFAKEVSVSIVKESAYNALITTLTELIPEIKDNLMSSVMRDSLVDSMKEVIKTVAWEVIPEIASKIIAEEIQKIKESS